MKVDGSCFCGELAFEAEIDPSTVELCHCRDCQVLSSSAFRIVVPATEGSFRLLSGTPTIYVKVAESGNRRNLAFCPTCGTAIYSAPADGKPGYFGLRAGTLKQRLDLVPGAQYWRRSALPWVDHLEQLPRHDTE
ncbi:MAG: GFA family protein [Aestuariivirgaceae bacterium]